MNRTSWPVLEILHKVSLILFLGSILTIPSKAIQADDQQVEQIPPYIIKIDAPTKTKVGEKTTISLKTTDRANAEKAYSKKVLVKAFITGNNFSHSENVTIKNGVGIIEHKFDNPGNYILTLMPSEEKLKTRPLASIALTAVLR